MTPLRMLSPLSTPPTPGELRSLFTYDLRTGELRWRVRSSRKVKIGDIAGEIGKSGYQRVMIGGQNYPAPTIIWAMMTGRWPVRNIDHRDTYGPKHGYGNRWENLREATISQNGMNRRTQANNKTGYPGVRRLPDGKWRAKIGVNGEQINLGTFVEKADAVAVRKATERKYFGEFAPERNAA